HVLRVPRRERPRDLAGRPAQEGEGAARLLAEQPEHRSRGVVGLRLGGGGPEHEFPGDRPNRRSTPRRSMNKSPVLRPWDIIPNSSVAWTATSSPQSTATNSGARKARTRSSCGLFGSLTAPSTPQVSNCRPACLWPQLNRVLPERIPGFVPCSCVPHPPRSPRAGRT